MLSIRELRDRAVIRPVKRAVEDQLLDLPGVTIVDIGEKLRAGRRTGEQVIVVSVMRKKPADELRPGTRIPHHVLGIPTDVVEEQPVLEHIHRGSQENLAPRLRRLRGGAVAGGAGIAPYRAAYLVPPVVPVPGSYRRIGTLGVLVTANEPSATTMGLTTFDVACLDDAWAVGDRMVDPAGGRVHADLARAALSGRVDAAAVTIASRLDTSHVVGGIGPVTGHAGTYPGERVRKCGFGTGLTLGVVTSVDATLRLDHGDSLGIRVLREQIRVDTSGRRYCGPGDSGAAVIDPGGRVIGLHVAGGRRGRVGFACPIGGVLDELDVALRTAAELVGP
ncbi:hypothetical protein [Saccharopolyspora cebuensis]|uniref:Trypsin-like peptidase domain-containing protein n=1 Tax=Saccharopolyspora cebuensis TaxID=418759 RepID=A0ABV4CMX2_9PSEU